MGGGGGVWEVRKSKRKSRYKDKTKNKRWSWGMGVGEFFWKKRTKKEKQIQSIKTHTLNNDNTIATKKQNVGK